MTPAIEVPCPPRYLVAEWMTTSAPHSSGRIRYGVAMVLSTTSGHPVLVGDGGDGLDVEQLGLRVGDRLAEEGLGVRADRGPPGLRVGVVLDEGHLDPELGEGVLEQVHGAAVEGSAGDDVVAGLGDVEQAEGGGRLAGRHEQGPDAPLEGRDPLLHGVLRRVHDPRVDVAELLEREEVLGVRGVVEDVRGRLVDRQRPGAGGAVGVLARVDLPGLEAPLGLVGHRHSWCQGAPAAAVRTSCVCSAGGPGSPALAGGGCRSPGPHPGHPTAEGGLPASEPGLGAGAHDLPPWWDARAPASHPVSPVGRTPPGLRPSPPPRRPLPRGRMAP